MKKPLALLLTAVLLAGIFCMGVSAERANSPWGETIDLEELKFPASVFLEGNLWIVLVIAVIVIAAIAVIVKKKKKK